MTSLAVALVLLSAVLHASWNLLTKRVNGGEVFVWLISAFSTLFLLPVAAYIVVVEAPEFGPRHLFFILLGSALHAAYYVALNRAYRAGDMSLIYPLARGAAPVLSIAGAVVLFGERPTPLVLTGAFLITVGTVVLTGNPLRLRGSATFVAVGYGLLTAVAVAAYTLVDKVTVGQLMVSPLLFIFVSSLFRLIVLAPAIQPQFPQAWRLWRDHRATVLAVALMDPLSYILFLTALAFSDISYVTPLRQASVLIGAAFGVWLLSEGFAVRRMAAAAVMMSGLVVVALQ